MENEKEVVEVIELTLEQLAIIGGGSIGMYFG